MNISAQGIIGQPCKNLKTLWSRKNALWRLWKIKRRLGGDILPKQLPMMKRTNVKNKRQRRSTTLLSSKENEVSESRELPVLKVPSHADARRPFLMAKQITWSNCDWRLIFVNFYHVTCLTLKRDAVKKQSVVYIL